MFIRRRKKEVPKRCCWTPKMGRKSTGRREKNTGKVRPDLAGAQKGGQREGDRMEDLVAVQAPSKHIRERVQRGSFNNHISIQADNGSLRPDNGSLLPMEEGGSCMEEQSCSFRSEDTMDLLEG